MKKIVMMIEKNKFFLFSCVFTLVVIVGVSSLLFKQDNKLQNNKKCIVTFDTAGGNLIKSQEIYCNTKLEKPENPQKDGFEFVNWVINGEVFDFQDLIKENIILTAIYNIVDDKELIIVDFETYGGTDLNSIEIVKGSTIKEPITPYLKNYEFKGWYYNNERFDFNSKIFNNITLEAKWEKTVSNNIKPNESNNSTKLEDEVDKNDKPENIDKNQETEIPKYDYINERPANKIVKCQYEDFSFDESTGYCYDIKSIKPNLGCPTNYEEDENGNCYYKHIEAPQYERKCVNENEVLEDGVCYKATIDTTEPGHKCPEGYRYKNIVDDIYYKGYCYYLKNEWNGEKYIRIEDKKDAEFYCESWKSLTITDTQAYCRGILKTISGLPKNNYYCKKDYTEIKDGSNIECILISYVDKEPNVCPYGYKLNNTKVCEPDNNIRKSKYTVEYECPEGNAGMPYILIDKTCYNKVPSID